ncbi:MAG TPA: sigma-70 family RNA polymerase sigma factor [Anaerolineales bacterium]|nr:sigma-70 family RNA polymerase sigma factor [Anaerolineales bacterium]
MTQEFLELPDETLVQLSKLRMGRDTRPFQVLFDRHYNMIWRVCFRFLRQAEDAQDLAQDVFYKAYRSLNQFEGRSSFKTWLYRIAINTCNNELRRLSRRPQINDKPIEEYTEFLPGAPDPESVWLEQERIEYLHKALKQLRPEEYEILVMKDIQQKSYNEVADAFDISISAAKMRVQRARLALLTVYKNLYNESVR